MASPGEEDPIDLEAAEAEEESEDYEDAEEFADADDYEDPAITLGRALRTNNDQLFKQAVIDLLDSDANIAISITWFMDRANDATPAIEMKAARNAMRDLVVLEDRILNLGCGGLKPYTGNSKLPCIPLLHPDTTLSWLSRRLAGIRSFRSAQSTVWMLAMELVRWLSWMTILDWGDWQRIIPFGAEIGLSCRETKQLAQITSKCKVRMLRAYELLEIPGDRNLRHIDIGRKNFIHQRNWLAWNARIVKSPEHDLAYGHSPAKAIIMSEFAPTTFSETGHIETYDSEIAVQLTPDGLPVMVVLDTGATSTLVSFGFLREHNPLACVKRLPKPTVHSGFDGKRTTVKHHALLDIYIPSESKGQSVLARIQHQVRVTQNLPSGVLFGQDIIQQQGIIIDAVLGRVTITKCGNAVTALRSTFRPIKQTL